MLYFRAQRACFGAAYMYYLLTEVYGIDIDDDISFLTNHQSSLDISWSFGAAVAAALRTSNTDDDLDGQFWVKAVVE